MKLILYGLAVYLIIMSLRDFVMIVEKIFLMIFYPIHQKIIVNEKTINNISNFHLRFNLFPRKIKIKRSYKKRN